jgi:hypothetical protein
MRRGLLTSVKVLKAVRAESWRNGINAAGLIFSQFFGPAKDGIDGRFRVEFGFTDLEKSGHRSC